MGMINRNASRLRRQKRVRKKICGTSELPRLCVFRSSRHIYAQIIDDKTGTTLAAVSSLSKEIASKIGNNGCNKKGAAMIGSAIAKAATSRDIKAVVFDRNGFLYHGRVKSLSDAAREHGLHF
jgi:large subunit ribosomal protein L18